MTFDNSCSLVSSWARWSMPHQGRHLGLIPCLNSYIIPKTADPLTLPLLFLIPGLSYTHTPGSLPHDKLPLTLCKSSHNLSHCKECFLQHFLWLTSGSPLRATLLWGPFFISATIPFPGEFLHRLFPHSSTLRWPNLASTWIPRDYKHHRVFTPCLLG